MGSQKPSLGQQSSNESIDTETVNPTVITKEVIELFAKHSILVGKLIRKGRYGAIFEGQFGEVFDMKQFSKDFKCDSIVTKSQPEKSQRFALKYIDIPVRKQLEVHDIDEAVVNEIKALTDIESEGVVKFFCAIGLSNKNQWFIFLELAEGNLQTFIRNTRRAKKTIGFELTKKWIKKLIQTVMYLHSKGITHGSIKASNILFFQKNKNDDNIDVKITDFVSSMVMKKDGNNSQLLTDKTDEDVIDLYFLITEILRITEFKSKDIEKSFRESIHPLMTSENKSIQILNTLLSSKHLSN